jgi:hypothetical protein
VRIGLRHLDDLEQRPAADGDVCAGLEDAPAYGCAGYVIQQARSPML